MISTKNVVFVIIFTILGMNNLFSAEEKAQAAQLSQRAEIASASATDLMNAVEKQDVDGVKELLERPATNINAQDIQGRNALFWAIDKDDAEISGLLLDAGIDINQKDRDGLTALQLTLLNGQIEIAKKILSACKKIKKDQEESGQEERYYRGCDVNAIFKRVKKGVGLIARTPLMVAVERNNIDLVKELLNMNANPYVPISKIEYDFMDIITTQLNNTVKKNDLNLVSTLIEKNYWVLTVDSLKAALNLAEDKPEIKKLLEESAEKIRKRKPSSNITSRDFITALNLAEDKPEIKKLLEEKAVELKKNAIEFERALADQRFDDANKILKDKSIDLHSHHCAIHWQIDYSPLISAINVGNKAPICFIKKLLALGSDPNFRTGKQSFYDGKTVLGIATIFGSIDAIKILVDAGASVNARNISENQSNTILFDIIDNVKLSKKDKYERAKLLLDLGADPNLGAPNPPLYRVLVSGNPDLVKLFLDKGADPETPILMHQTESAKRFISPLEFVNEIFGERREVNNADQITHLLKDAIIEKKKRKAAETAKAGQSKGFARSIAKFFGA